MFGLTPLGVFHTAISVVAVVAGLIALFRDGRITSATRVGMIYILTTAVTCLTGFGIFQHGGFNKAHVLGIITLVVLGIAWTAGHSTLFGRASRYVETIGYSATMLFNLIPGITETTTRLPLGAPLLPNADAPALQMASGVLLVLFLVVAVLQARSLRMTPPASA